LYELADSDLRLAFFDGLGEKPAGFTVPPGNKDPMLIVLRLRPVR
jgi:hypothetical protein